MAMFDSVTISSGHGKYVAGASCYLNEVEEARKVVNKVAEYMKQVGVKVNTIHDDVSKTKAQNITSGKSSYLISKHNATNRELDVSVHFNAASKTDSPRGVEVFYYSDSALATKVSKAIADAAGFKDRGAKSGKHLVFCSSTSKKAILIEVCFVDSAADAELYRKNFDKICRAIAEVLSGKKIPEKGSSASDTRTVIGVVEIIVPELSLRKGPGTSNELIRTLKKGERYKVFEQDQKTGWYNLGIDKWCSGSSKYVKFTKA